MLFDLKCNDCGDVSEYITKSSDISDTVCCKCSSANMEKYFSSAPAFNEKAQSFKSQQKSAKRDLTEWVGLLDRVAPGSNNRKLL